jgi:hypothetical protein
MTKKLIKVSIAMILLGGLLGSSLNTKAYPAYLRQAQKYGAKDCMFCHNKAEGGEGWNVRGQWLIDEKERRKADAIDVEWLAEYKEGNQNNKVDKKDSEKAETDKSDHSEHSEKSDKREEGKEKDKSDKKQDGKEKTEESKKDKKDKKDKPN